MTVGWFGADNYWIGRLLFQRALAAVYLVAFLVARNQFRALLGSDGMLPIPRFVAAVPFRRSPSIFHRHYSDRFFAAVTWAGIMLSATTLVGITERLPLGADIGVWFLLWALYLSIVNVGQTWYGFGWESLLLEAGFLAILLGGSTQTPPLPLLILLRWLLFRLEFGAGLIKIRGDSCWLIISGNFSWLNWLAVVLAPLSAAGWLLDQDPAGLAARRYAGQHPAAVGGSGAGRERPWW